MSENANNHTYDLTSMSERKTIVVHANTNQLANIKSLIPLNETGQIESIGNDIYELNIDTIDILVPEILKDMAVDDLDESPPQRTVAIKSFPNSARFYSGAKGANGYKIISDEFSDILNTELYKGFSLIERKLRQLVIENFQKKGRPSARPRRSQTNVPDHVMSQYELGEFLRELLKSPASSGFMKAEWRRSVAKDEDELIRIASLTVMDEVNPGLTLDELENIRKQRNKCMHFNVVTVAEYKKIVPIMNKYLRATAGRELARSMSGIAERIRLRIEDIFLDFNVSPSSKLLSEIATSQVRQAKILSGAMIAALKDESDLK